MRSTGMAHGRRLEIAVSIVRRGLVVLVSALLLGMAAPNGADVPAPGAQPACIPAARCCKVCSKGQACGNTCISRRFTCHKGRGCACDAEEVCE
jgi:hypothetical protein